MILYSITGDFSLIFYIVDPMLSNTMLDGVLYCLCFCFSCILLPDIMMLTQCCCALRPYSILSVDPMLLPSGNLGKNAMERFHGLIPDIILYIYIYILLTQCYPITMLDGVVLYGLCLCLSCVLLPDIILLTQMLCPSPPQYTVDPMPWRGFVVAGFVFVAFYPN